MRKKSTFSTHILAYIYIGIWHNLNGTWLSVWAFFSSFFCRIEANTKILCAKRWKKNESWQKCAYDPAFLFNHLPNHNMTIMIEIKTDVTEHFVQMTGKNVRSYEFVSIGWNQPQQPTHSVQCAKSKRENDNLLALFLLICFAFPASKCKKKTLFAVVWIRKQKRKSRIISHIFREYDV